MGHLANPIGTAIPVSRESLEAAAGWLARRLYRFNVSSPEDVERDRLRFLEDMTRQAKVRQEIGGAIDPGVKISGSILVSGRIATATVTVRPDLAEARVAGHVGPAWVWTPDRGGRDLAESPAGTAPPTPA